MNKREFFFFKEFEQLWVEKHLSSASILITAKQNKDRFCQKTFLNFFFGIKFQAPIT